MSPSSLFNHNQNIILNFFCIFLIFLPHHIPNLPRLLHLHSSPSIVTHLKLTLGYIMNTLSVRAPSRAAAKPQYLHLAVRTYSGVAATTLNPACGANKRTSILSLTSKRPISSTPQNQITDYFPPPKAPNVKEVQTAWVHPV